MASPSITPQLRISWWPLCWMTCWRHLSMAHSRESPLTRCPLEGGDGTAGCGHIVTWPTGYQIHAELTLRGFELPY